MSDASRAPNLPRPAGSVSLKLLLVLVTAIFGALGISWLPGGGEPEEAESGSAALLPPPSDTTFIYGWVVDSASPTGRNYVEQITIPVALGQQYWLQIVNGAPGGTNRVDSLKGKWNGKNIIGASDFNSLTDESERVIAATQTDTLQLLIFGPTTSYVSVAVFSVPDPTFNIFGESTYTKTNSNSQTFTSTFTKPSDAFTKYYLFVVNGDSTGAQRVSSAQVKVNGTTVVQSTDVTTAIGSVVKFVNNVQSGTNEIQVTLTGTANKFVQVRLAASDSTAPVVTLTAPAESSYTNLTNVPVTGTLSDRTAVKVTVNGQSATVTSNTSFSGTANLTTDGWHTLTVVATDVPKLQTTKTRMIKRDTQAPSLVVSTPAVDLYTQSASVTVSGTASDANPFRVRTNGTEWAVTGGTFSGNYTLAYGANTLVTVATDTAGNQTADSRVVTRDTIPPALTVSAPANGSSTTADSVTVTGTASDANPFTLTVNGIATTVSGGAFSRKIALAVGSNTITTIATDGAGNVRSDSRAVTRTQPGPDTIPTPINPTVATGFAKSTDFIYTGSNPIQTGVAPGTIVASRAAVVRGKVLDRTGAALTGATITIVGHSEFGQTLSRAPDGRYELAVNGGDLLVLQFTKSGYLPVQRQVTPDWLNYAVLDSVVMIALDPDTTRVQFTQPIEIARGSSQSDSSGTRRATLMFEQGTQATIVMPDNSTIAISSARVRATEFTVGTLGAAAMPGNLPPTTAYTYAAELTVDTALALGAKSVTFSKPVAFYVENFLGIPVGHPVPYAYYDRTAGRWIPEPDGRVIKVRSDSSGYAVLEVDTTGQAAAQAQYDTLGITLAERRTIDSLYAVGQTLWRTEHSHFTPGDWNWPFWFPLDAISPNGGPPTNNQRPQCQGQRSGSIITCESQVLGEAVPLTGAPYSLHYASDRTPGYTADYTLDIPLRGDTIPPSVKAVEVQIDIAGRHIVQRYPRSQFRTQYVWDGKDVFGRYVQGRQAYKVGLGFVYDATLGQGRRGVPGGGFGGGTGTPYANFARREVMILIEWRGYIGPWNVIPFGLGGWTLSAHHAYDPWSRTLHLGTGERRPVEIVGNIIENFAGTGVFGFSGNNVPAKQAQVYGPERMTVGPDGTLYFADVNNHRIRKVTPDGTISTVAGTGVNQSNGDGGAATSAAISNPTGVALGSDGSLYIAERAAHKVRRVAPDGIISTFAGTGTAGFNGEGVRADSALLSSPYDVAVGPDGSVYIADFGNNRIRRVSPNGRITTVAGNPTGSFNDSLPATATRLVNPIAVDVANDGSLVIANQGQHQVRKVAPSGLMTIVANRFASGGFNGDGIQARNALIFLPTDVAFGSDGSIFISDKSNNRIRRVAPSGIITTITGTNQRACSPRSNSPPCVALDGDGDVATVAALHGAFGIAIGPDGTLYVADSDGDEIRRVTAAMPGAATGTFLVASADGGVAYQFDADGRHEKTLDGLTGATLLTFIYDTVGRVVSLVDADSNVTTIQRAADGRATAILAPFGQKTTLMVDSAQLLTAIANPGGETVRLHYKTSGLLDTLTTPRGHKSVMAYDSLGRLTSDLDPAGGGVTLVRAAVINPVTKADTGYAVVVTTAMGRTTRYAIDQLPTTAGVRTVTDGAGLRTSSTFGVDQSITTRLPDSTVITTTLQADPRWGRASSTIKAMAVMTPMGTVANIAAIRRDSMATPGNPFSLVSQVDSLSVNGNWTVATYTSSTRRLVQVSPEGRQVIATLDGRGRVVAAQVDGLDSVIVVYDAKGRPSQRIDGGRTTTFSYHVGSGLLASVTDPLGRATHFSYDSAGRATSQTLPDGRAITFTYDSAGNLTSLTPPGRPAHGFQYTPIGFTKQYDPPGIPGQKPTRYFYNLDRQVDSVVRADSSVIHFQYDTAGRVASVSFDGGLQTYGYSATSGRLVAVRTPTGDSLKVIYDGILPTQFRWSGSVSGSVAVKYNADFRVDSQYVNAANGVGFTYDRDGLLRTAGALRVGRSATTGLLLADTLNSIVSTYQHTSRGELRGYHVKRGGTSLLGVGYARDSLGRITRLDDTTQGTPMRWSFVYDNVGRLKADSVDGALLHSFLYDSNGNRLSYSSNSGVVTYRYDAQDRLLASYAGGDSTTYAYGSNGELKIITAPGGATTKLTYDALGNLLKVVLPSGDSVEYLIDGQSRRVGRKFNGATTHRWLYHGQLRPVAEVDSVGNVISRFVYGTRKNVPDYMTRGGSVYRLVTDHLGSVRLVVDTSTGAIAQSMDYDEWGVVTAEMGAGFQPFGFAGGLSDSATRLTRFGARDYMASAGRWLAQDPILHQGGSSNLYGYALEDPINYVDLDGKQAIAIPIVLEGIGLGAAATVAAPLVLVGTAVYAGYLLSEALDDASERAINRLFKEACIEGCMKYLPSPSGDLQCSEFHQCVEECLQSLGA